MDSTLGAFLGARLKTDGLSVRAFARKLGATSSYVSKVIRGTRPVPYSRIADWIAALGLQGGVAEEFREMALLALSPVEVRELVAELRGKLERRGEKKGRT